MAKKLTKKALNRKIHDLDVVVFKLRLEHEAQVRWLEEQNRTLSDIVVSLHDEMGTLSLAVQEFLTPSDGRCAVMSNDGRTWVNRDESAAEPSNND